MDKERRRLIALIGSVIVGIVAALLGWLLLLREPPAQETPDPTFPEPAERSVAFFERKEGEEGGYIAATEPETQEELALLQLWDRPVAALTFAQHNTQTRVRFVERESGDIYETSRLRLTSRIYNTATPAIQRGWFGAKGNALAIQFLPDDDGTLTTFEGPLDPLEEPDPETGSFVTFQSAPLPDRIASLAYDPSGGDRFATLEVLPEGGGARLVVHERGKPAKELWRSTVRSWHISWTHPKSILVVANTQPNRDGVALAIDPSSGKQRLLVAANTLDAVLSPSGNLLAYSAREGRDVRLFVRDLTQGKEVATGISTIAQKCSWGVRNSREVLVCAVPRTGIVPDNIIWWYQGGGYFDDVLVIVEDPQEGGRILLDPSDRYKVALDVASLEVSPDGNEVLLFDKRTLTPWLVLLDVLEKEAQKPASQPSEQENATTSADATPPSEAQS